MKMTVGEALDKLNKIEDLISDMDRIGDEYCVCLDASELLCEYRELILKTNIDI